MEEKWRQWFRENAPEEIVQEMEESIAWAAQWRDDHIVELEKRSERYQQWINDLQSGMYINCVYCGHRYGPREETPVNMSRVLKEHIEQCPEHPLSAMKRRAEELEADRQEAIDMLQMAYRKHVQNDPRIGWNELGESVGDTLSNLMGVDEFCKWQENTALAVALREDPPPAEEPLICDGCGQAGNECLCGGDKEGVAMKCKKCGCTHGTACPGGCSWVDADKCSACFCDCGEELRTEQEKTERCCSECKHSALIDKQEFKQGTEGEGR